MNYRILVVFFILLSNFFLTNSFLDSSFDVPFKVYQKDILVKEVISRQRIGTSTVKIVSLDVVTEYTNNQIDWIEVNSLQEFIIPLRVGKNYIQIKNVQKAVSNVFIIFYSKSSQTSSKNLIITIAFIATYQFKLADGYNGSRRRKKPYFLVD